MNWIRIKNFTLVVLINLVILISILGLIEIVFRVNFEEFKNHIHSSQKTLGKNSITSNFYGNDVDGKMVRLATMNLTLRNLNNVKIIKKNPLTQTFDKQFKIDNQIPLNGFEVILANPPFKGSIDSNRIVDDVKVGDTKKTQILFIKYILNSLKKNGRAAIVVPDGVLFDTEFGFEEIRRQLLDKTNLHTIVSLPKGVFEPYSGVKTSILCCLAKLVITVSSNFLPRFFCLASLEKQDNSRCSEDSNSFKVGNAKSGLPIKIIFAI